MTVNPNRAWDRRWRVSGALLALVMALAAWTAMSREAGAQTSRKPKPAAAKGGDTEAPGPALREFETVKLNNGTEVQVEKWGQTYPAYEYRPPLDILDKHVHVVLDSERDGAPGHVTALVVDSKGGWLYWCDGLNRPSPVGRVMRSRLDGSGVQALATGRVWPRNLVFDPRRGRIYWLEGLGNFPCRLQAATLDGKGETTLSKGLNKAHGLALDSARGQLYYWEEYRLVRVNVDGTGEEVITANPRAVHPPFTGLAFDAAHERLIASTTVGGPRWLNKDGTHVEYVPRLEHLGTIYGFAFDEDHQKAYFATNNQALFRANVDGTQVETLVTSPAVCEDGSSRSIAGAVALDPSRGQLYWTGGRMRGGAFASRIYRADLRPLPEPIERPAPPRVAAIAPSEQGAGGEVVLSGDDLVGAFAVSFIDDSTGAHVEAKFRPAGEGRLAVTVPRLGDQCRRPVVVVQTPGGVTMTMGIDVQAPKLGPAPYEDVHTVALDKRLWWEGLSFKTDRYERSPTGMLGQVWLRPGLQSGHVESAVVYAQRGSSLTIGPKAMVTTFAKDDCYVAVSAGYPYDNVVVYHEPFAVFLFSTYYNTTVKRIPVPAIRPSFPEQPFRYRAD